MVIVLLNGFLMPPHPLTNFEIQKYYQNEPRFNGVYSRDNLTEKKDGAYVINLDEYYDIRIHWVALYVHNNDGTYFDSFGVEHTPKEIKAFINNKNIKPNIFRIQAYDLIMYGFIVIGFIEINKSNIKILYWIYWFYACGKDLNWIYDLFFAK